MNSSLETALALITIIAASSAGFVRLAVDIYKMARPAAKTWELIAMAIISGQLLTFLLGLAAGALIQVATPLSQTIAQYLFAGLIAASGAIGMHNIGTAASESRLQAVYGNPEH